MTPDKVLEARAEKLRNRIYFTIDLSSIVIREGIPYRCWKCGKIVTTIYNQPKTMVEVKIAPEDVEGHKPIGSLCVGDNIMFIFV